MTAAGHRKLSSAAPCILRRVRAPREWLKGAVPLPALHHVLLPLVATLAALTALTAVPAADCAALPAGRALASQPGGDTSSTGVDFLPDLGMSQPQNGTIVAYRGVDTSRGHRVNVTAFVNVWGAGDGGRGDGGSNGSDGGYQIVNASMSVNAPAGNVSRYDFFSFAGYTSYDYAVVDFRLLLPGVRDVDAFIDASTGYCINYTETFPIESGVYLTVVANDTTALYTNDSMGGRSVYYNVDLRYVDPVSSETLEQDVYMLVQNVMNSAHALNTTSEALFSLGPHGPYPLDKYGFPVVRRNDAGEALRPQAAAAPPPGKASVRAWDVGAPTLVVAVLTCLAAAAAALL